jgi:ribosomal protein S18 acetylase RimI-like enzyme
MTRPPTIDDLPALRRALEACGTFSAEEVSVAMEILVASIERPDDYTTFVHDVDGPAGYITLGRTPLTASTWHCYWLCVHPAHQRRGVGAALLEHAEHWLHAVGGRDLVVETSGRADYEPARRFYSRAGYAVVGRIPDFYKPGDDCVILHKRLAPPP